MARPRKKTIEEELQCKQEEYIKARKHCDELANEIDRLSKLAKEEKVKMLISALEKSTKTYEDVMAFIQAEKKETNEGE